MKKNNNGKILIETLIKNIRQEISSIDEIHLQIESLIEAADKASLEEKGFYNRAAGSILHDFYTGLEKIFCDVANKIDSGLAKQEDWHIRLLKSMAEDTKKRPKVISLKSMEELKEYLGFRHLFRNIYGAQLDWGRLKILLLKIRDDLWKRLKEEFVLFLDNIG